MKATEAELKAVNRKLRLLGQYYKTKPVYREYVKGRKQKEFFSAHQLDLELYEATTKELREVFGDEKLLVINRNWGIWLICNWNIKKLAFHTAYIARVCNVKQFVVFRLFRCIWY